MEKIRLFIKDYSEELLNKVKWPTFEQLQSSTVIVLVSSLMIALVIGLIDLVFNFSLNFIYGLFQ